MAYQADRHSDTGGGVVCITPRCNEPPVWRLASHVSRAIWKKAGNTNAGVKWYTCDWCRPPDAEILDGE